MNGALLFLNMFFLALIFILAFKLKKANNECDCFSLYLKKLINIVSQVRYGNLKARMHFGKDDITLALSENINSMFESISDRDVMIQEYILKEKEANILKTDFIATLTHDLKVPIIAQDKTCDLLLNNKFGEITEMQKQAIENLKISNLDLKFLVEALLETYKIEQTKIKLDIEYGVDLLVKMGELIEQIEPVALAHNKKINFYPNISKGIKVDVDVFLLKRVVQNLILNALSHSQNSDCVDILLKIDENEGGNFQIDIKDYGIGIEKSEIKKIFNKYYSGSSKFMKSGVGLGLYLSNKIVIAHMGKIEVSSKINSGSTFSVILPKKIAPTQV